MTYVTSSDEEFNAYLAKEALDSSGVLTGILTADGEHTLKNVSASRAKNYVVTIADYQQNKEAEKNRRDGKTAFPPSVGSDVIILDGKKVRLEERVVKLFKRGVESLKTFKPNSYKRR
jgi:hypothetical protein